jgi:hypothetical protein
MGKRLQVNKVYSQTFVVRKLKPELHEAAEHITELKRQSVALGFAISKAGNIPQSPSEREVKPNVQVG